MANAVAAESTTVLEMKMTLEVDEEEAALRDSAAAAMGTCVLETEMVVLAVAMAIEAMPGEPMLTAVGGQHMSAHTLVPGSGEGAAAAMEVEG